MKHAHRDRDNGIVLIAAFKLVKALLLIAVGLGTVGIMRAGIAGVSRRVLSTVSSGTERAVTESMLSKLSGMSPRHIEALGVGAFLYAALFLVEALGLWLQKRWAEYLTVIATGSFIPFEIYELVRRITAARLGALVLNIAVVIYLVIRLAKRKVPIARSGA